MRATAVELLTAAPACGTAAESGQHTRWPGRPRVLGAPLLLLRAVCQGFRTFWRLCGYQPAERGRATTVTARETPVTGRNRQHAGKEQRPMDAQRNKGSAEDPQRRIDPASLCAYDRVTVSLWRDGHAAVAAGRVAAGMLCLAEAAAHGLLAVLRRCADPPELLARYEASSAEEDDLLLIASLLPTDSGGGADDTPLRRIREAGFYLRWLELGGPCST